jgi:hypothetical protein
MEKGCLNCHWNAAIYWYPPIVSSYISKYIVIEHRGAKKILVPCDCGYFISELISLRKKCQYFMFFSEEKCRIPFEIYDESPSRVFPGLKGDYDKM